MAEKNNELLLQNHQSRPTGSKAFPEVNATFASPIATDKGTKMGRLWGKDEDVVVVEGVAVVIIPDIITPVPSKIRKAIPIKGSSKIHKQPLARVSLNANKIIPAIDMAWQVIGHVPVVRPNIWLISTKLQSKTKARILKSISLMMMVMVEWI